MTVPERKHSCIDGFRWMPHPTLTERLADNPLNLSPKGTIVRCDCGRSWTVAQFPTEYRNAVVFSATWRRASWWERRRARKAGL